MVFTFDLAPQFIQKCIKIGFGARPNFRRFSEAGLGSFWASLDPGGFMILWVLASPVALSFDFGLAKKRSSVHVSLTLAARLQCDCVCTSRRVPTRSEGLLNGADVPKGSSTLLNVPKLFETSGRVPKRSDLLTFAASLFRSHWRRAFNVGTCVCVCVCVCVRVCACACVFGLFAG